MAKDLTTSAIERQNVLNNNMAIPRIQEVLNVEAFHFDGKYYLTKQMVADFYEVDVRTIDNYLAANEAELKHNGYFLCKGNLLKDLKLQFAHEKTFATKIKHPDNSHHPRQKHLLSVKELMLLGGIILKNEYYH